MPTYWAVVMEAYGDRFRGPADFFDCKACAANIVPAAKKKDDAADAVAGDDSGASFLG